MTKTLVYPMITPVSFGPISIHLKPPNQLQFEALQYILRNHAAPFPFLFPPSPSLICIDDPAHVKNHIKEIAPRKSAVCRTSISSPRRKILMCT